MWASGLNTYGQLGDGTTVNKSTPVQVMSGAIAVACGGRHSLFLKSDGSVWASGLNNYGQLGDGTTGSKSTPVQVLNPAVYNGIISGSGGLVLSGSRIQSLGTQNLYTGPTMLRGGVLLASSLGNGGTASTLGASSSDAIPV